MKQLVTLISFLLLVACNSELPDDTFVFSHKDFPKTIKAEVQVLELDSIVNYDKIYCIGDSLLLANNDDPAQTNKVQLYSLDGKRKEGGFAQLGHSKSELISCDIHYCYSGSDIFYVEDVIQNKYWICSADSLKNNKSCVLNNFNYSKDVISLCPLDSTYIGLNFWFLDDIKYNNGIVNPLAIYSCKEQIGKERSKQYDYFVANVSGGSVFCNPNNNDVWLAYKHDNKICIYDKELHLKKQLQGPYKTEKKLLSEEMKGKSYIMFGANSYMACYYDAAYTQNYVYLIYRNINNTPFPKVSQPVEIFKLTWQGELVANYQLDRFAYSISVDSSNEYLYATCKDPITFERQFVRLKL